MKPTFAPMSLVSPALRLAGARSDRRAGRDSRRGGQAVDEGEVGAAVGGYRRVSGGGQKNKFIFRVGRSI